MPFRCRKSVSMFIIHPQLSGVSRETFSKTGCAYTSRGPPGDPRRSFVVVAALVPEGRRWEAGGAVVPGTKSSNEYGRAWKRRDDVGSRLFSTRIRHGQYNGCLLARASASSYCPPPIKLSKVRHYGRGARPISPVRSSARSRTQKGVVARARPFSRLHAHRHHGLFQLSVGRYRRRDVRDFAVSAGGRGVTTAATNGRYDIMSHKGTRPESRRRVNRPVNVARINRAVSSHHKNVTLRRLPAAI